VNPLTKATISPVPVGRRLRSSPDDRHRLDTDALGKGQRRQKTFLPQRDLADRRRDPRNDAPAASNAEMFTRRIRKPAVKGQRICWNAIDTAGGAFVPVETKEHVHSFTCPSSITSPAKAIPDIGPIRGARVSALLADSVTTDHISPARRDRGRTDRPEPYLQETASEVSRVQLRSVHVVVRSCDGFAARFR